MHVKSNLKHLYKVREILDKQWSQRGDLSILEALEEIEWVISEHEWELRKQESRRSLEATRGEAETKIGGENEA